jgi:hypothetical protein
MKRLTLLIFSILALAFLSPASARMSVGFLGGGPSGNGGPSALYTAAVAIWDMEQGSSSNATDTKGSYDLTYRGDPQQDGTIEKQGSYCSDLDGTGDSYDTNGDQAVFDPGGDFSVACWVQWDIEEPSGLIHKFDYTTSGDGWQFGLDWNTDDYYLKSFFLNSWAEDIDFFTWSPSPDTWYHVVLSFDDSANVVTLWVSTSTWADTVNAETITVAITPGDTTYSLDLGGDSVDLAGELNGFLDECVYFNLELVDDGGDYDPSDIFDGSWRS